jgi:hypothetical protein
VLTTFKQKAEAARAEHSASVAPVAPPPYTARRVKLILTQPQAQPEKEGEDLAMAVDEGNEVSHAITGSFSYQFLTFERLLRAVGGLGLPHGLPLRESGRTRRQRPKRLQNAAPGQRNAHTLPILSRRVQTPKIPAVICPGE